VGLVYWAVNHAGGTIVRERTFSGDRQQIQMLASFAALALVRDVCLGKAS
jgi:nicotinamide-nucleotide amidase